MAECPVSISEPDPPRPAALSETIFLLPLPFGPFCPHTTPPQSGSVLGCILCGTHWFGAHWPLFLTCIIPTHPSLLFSPCSTLQPEKHFKQTNLIISLICLKSFKDFQWPLGKSSNSLGYLQSPSLFLSHVCSSLLPWSSHLSCALSCLHCWQGTGPALGHEALPILVSLSLCLRKSDYRRLWVPILMLSLPWVHPLTSLKLCEHL